SNDRNSLIPTDLAGAVFAPPNAPLYDETGDLLWNENGANFGHPLAALYRSFSSVTDNLISNAYMGYRILPGLRVKLNSGYTSTQLDETSVVPAAAYNPAYNIASGSSRFGYHQVKSWIAEPQLNYDFMLAGGKTEILLGASWQQETRKGNAIRASDYSNEALSFSLTESTTIRNSNTYS